VRPVDQIVHEETVTGGSSASKTVKTSATLTAASEHLYLAAIATKKKVSVTEVSGLGLSWSLVQAQCSGGTGVTGIEVWMAQGTPSSNDTVRATLASAPTNAVIVVSRYSGVVPPGGINPIGNVISGNTNGLNGLCTGGVDTSFYSFNLTTTADGARIYGAATMRTRLHTPGAGYTERADLRQGSGGNTASAAVEDGHIASATTAVVNGSFNGNVDWAMVALEILPQNASASLTSKDLHVDDETETNERKPDDLAASFLDHLALHPNYPNPFNAQTTIEYTLPMEGSAQLFVFNVYGQVVRRLANGRQPAGTHRVVWDGKDAHGKEVPSGIYYCHLRSGKMTLVRQMTVVK
jgi:hypothetical protein